MNYFYFCNPFNDLVKNRVYIGNGLKVFTLLCGILAITISSLNNIIEDKIEEGLSRIDNTREDGKTDHDQQAIYLPEYLASISSFQVNVDLLQSILFEVPCIKEIKIWYENILVYRSLSFFVILFQNIIAPNAP